MSFQLRLVIGLSLTVLFSLIVTSAVITTLAGQNFAAYSQERYQQELTAKMNLIAEQVESLFTFYSNQIEQMASQQTVVEAAEAFTFDFNNYLDQSRTEPDMARQAVQRYYDEEFIPRLPANGQRDAIETRLLEEIGEQAIMLQYSFIANNPNPVGQKDELANARDWDKTAYAFEHRSRHSDYRSFLKQFKYYDVFIVDADTGNIVYSVYKEIDFATNLNTGPFKDSGIAEAFRAALDLAPGESYVTDFVPYLPSYYAPASFMSSPIYDEDTLKAVLIFQLPLDEINSTLTKEGRWADYGFGETGETFLVGSDGYLKSEFRQFMQSPDEFLSRLDTVDAEAARNVRLFGTTVDRLPNTLASAQRALNGESGFMIETGLFGNPQYTAYKPFVFQGIRWAVVSTNDASETDASITQLVSRLTGISAVTTLVMIVLAAGIAVVLAKFLIRPLSTLKERFAALNSAEADLSSRVEPAGVPEIDQISEYFNQFIGQIQTIIINVKDGAAQISSSASQLKQATDQSTALASQQLTEAEEVNDSVQDFTREFDRVAQRGVEAAEQTSLARNEARDSTQQSAQTRTTIQNLVHEISESSGALQQLEKEVSRINDVLMQITAIADQTNLLALNAAIEAARAGESGRGFAVVADEVRSLARRTQESTIEIQEKTDTLNKVVETAVDSMKRATNGGEQGLSLVENVEASIHSLDRSVEQLAHINDEVAQSAQQQKATTHSVSRNVESVKSASEELNRSAEQVAQATDELSHLAARLNSDVERFRT